jgi:hypothetical protein
MNGVILEQKAGSKIPGEITEAAYKEYPNCFGYAAASNGELLIGAGTTHGYEDVTGALDICNEMFTNVICHLGKGDSMKEEDAQPFLLLKDDAGKALLVAFLEGDFDNHQSDNGHTNEATCVKDYLMPQVDMLYELADKDISKLMLVLQKPATQKTLISYFGERGSIIFLNHKGETANAEVNDNRRSFDWGSASHLEDPPPDTGTPAAPEPAANDIKGKLAALKAKRAAEAAAKTNPPGVHDTTATAKQFVPASDAERFNTEQKAKKGPQAPLQEDLQNASALATLSNPDRLIYPNADECRTENTLKQFYFPNWGTCPDHWKLAVGHPEKAVGMPFNKLKENSPLRKGNSLADLVGRTVAVAAKPQKDVTTHHVADESKVGGFPIIGGKNKHQFGELVKTVDLKSRDIPKPDEIQEIEKKASTFFDQFGVKPEDFAYHWPEDKITQLAYNKEWADVCKLLIMSLKYKLATFYSTQKQLPDSTKTSVPATGSMSIQDRLAARKAQRG